MTKIAYERMRNKSLERKVRVLIIAGFVKDLIIIGLIIIGLAKLIGG